MTNQINPEKNRTLTQQPNQKSSNHKNTKIVVIGASHAGISFCDQLRRKGFQGELTIIEKRRGAPLERPPLSKGFLLEPGDDVNPIYLLKRAKWYKEQKVTLKHGHAVDKIDPKLNIVTLVNDEIVQFDFVIIATGAIPRNLEGTENLSRVFMLRQPDDAINIRNAARAVNSATIIGGGYIGLEVAATLRKMGLEIRVIEAAERLLARVASPPIAKKITELHLKHGVSLHTNCGTKEIHSINSSFDSVTLTDGTQIKSDMLIVGIGVVPDSVLALKAGLETETKNGGAILVDEFMRTSKDNILAIGDVALKHGNSIRIESVHNAQDSAARAVATIIGERQPAYEAPRFWSDQYDANLQSVGIVPLDLEDVYQVLRPGNSVGAESFWSYHKKQLLAVETIKDIENFMLGTKCLNNDISPDPSLISNPNFDPLS